MAYATAKKRYFSGGFSQSQAESNPSKFLKALLALHQPQYTHLPSSANPTVRKGTISNR
jgi:hypothetical protein